MFRIKFPTKRIFLIFPVLRTDGMAPLGTYLWNDPRINRQPHNFQTCEHIAIIITKIAVKRLGRLIQDMCTKP